MSIYVWKKWNSIVPKTSQQSDALVDLVRNATIDISSIGSRSRNIIWTGYLLCIIFWFFATSSWLGLDRFARMYLWKLTSFPSQLFTKSTHWCLRPCQYRNWPRLCQRRWSAVVTISSGLVPVGYSCAGLVSREYGLIRRGGCRRSRSSASTGTRLS